MDATVATGAAAMMAIRVLLDHEVPEENIFIVSLLMADSGKSQTFIYIILFLYLLDRYAPKTMGRRLLVLFLQDYYSCIVMTL